MTTISRKEAERQFHNQREVLRKNDSTAHDEFYSNRKIYQTAIKSKKYLDNWLRRNCPNKQVLDYCCGTGETSMRAAEYGAILTGIDISDVSIETCKERAIEKGLQASTQFYTMDAEHTSFKDNTFDVAICNGVLHHLDLDSAYAELARVLKPDGIIICIEALANNPIIHRYRRNTPELRTAWEVEHILTTKKIRSARRYFDKVQIKYFHLASLAAIPFIGKPGFQSALKIFNSLDEIILQIPGLRRFAWQAIFTLSTPKK